MKAFPECLMRSMSEECCCLQIVTASSGLLQPANPDILEGVDDLIKLSYLNEPAVLHDLTYRYSRDMIYVRPVPASKIIWSMIHVERAQFWRFL